MIPFRYRIKLFDPLFYAREGLAASHTPPVLHATAVNNAVCCAMSVNVDQQPFVIADANGGMDNPRYKNSLISDQFYFTPASVRGSADDWPEIVKGDSEGFFFKVVPGEILKASRLHFLAPETEFQGLGLAEDPDTPFPGQIRLGSFRGVASLTMEFATRFKRLPEDQPHGVDHPVDPLVSTVRRGVMQNMFPYPVVENAVCENVFEAIFERPRLGARTARLAWPNGLSLPQLPDRVKTGSTAIV